MALDDHTFCNYLSLRSIQLSKVTCCPITHCPNVSCPFSIHKCKLEDHLQYVCLYQRINCVNAEYGCSSKVIRRDMTFHLKRCPASVVRCPAEWNRWALFLPGSDSNRSPDDITIIASSNEDSLEMALLKRDQMFSDASQKIPLKLKSALRNKINKKYPAVPVEVPLTWNGNQEDANGKFSSVSISDDTNIYWNESSAPPEILQSSKPDFEENLIDQVCGSLTSLPALYDLLVTFKNCIELDDQHLAVESDNVAEVLNHVEMNLQKVERIISGVLHDLVIYPKKIAEKLMDIASDLDDWADDLGKVGHNLVPVINYLQPFAPKANTPNSSLILTSALQMKDHLKFAVKFIISMSNELNKAERITTGTKPQIIAQNLKKNVIIPLSKIAGKDVESLENEVVGVQYALVSNEESFVDMMSLFPFLEDRNPPEHAKNYIPNVGLAGLKSLAESYAKPAIELEELKFELNNVEKCDEVINELPKGISLRIGKDTFPRSLPKPKSVHTFLCAHDLRRDEIHNHSKVVHDIIDSGFGSWVDQNCPMARLGCPFRVTHIVPESENGRIVYDKNLNAFGAQTFSGYMAAPNESISLDSLPNEILEQIFINLDGFSLNQVSKVSKSFRAICFSLLEEKGMVTPVWRRISKGGEDFSSAWRISHFRWSFSTNANVTKWYLTDAGAQLHQHLKICQFYEKVEKQKQRVIFSDPEK